MRYDVVSLLDANTRNYVIKLSGTNDPFYLKAEIHDENGIKLGTIRDKNSVLGEVDLFDSEETPIIYSHQVDDFLGTRYEIYENKTKIGIVKTKVFSLKTNMTLSSHKKEKLLVVTGPGDIEGTFDLETPNGIKIAKIRIDRKIVGSLLMLTNINEKKADSAAGK